MQSLSLTTLVLLGSGMRIISMLEGWEKVLVIVFWGILAAFQCYYIASAAWKNFADARNKNIDSDNKLY